MMNRKEEIFEQIKEIFKSKNLPYEKAEKAFRLADNLHINQKRKDGTPYIIHPLEVALILAKVGFDEDFVCAGLLHDIVEDCDYTIKTIRNEFGKLVAEMVDAVSSIENEGFNYSEENQSDLYVEKDFDHQTVDEQTFKKLIKLGKENPAGFFIKFADRLHNLSTIESFPYYKQVEKVRETERWIIPLAEILKTDYFYREIKNYCFRILNKHKLEDFYYIYWNHIEHNRRNVKNVLEKLNSVLIKYNPNVKIEYDLVKEFEVYNILKEKGYIKNLNGISQSQINNIPLYNIYIIEQTISKNGRFDFIYRRNKQLESLFTIIDAKINEFSKDGSLTLCDNSRIMYNLYHMTESEYLKYRLGTDEYAEDVDDENTHDVIRYISVKTRSGETFHLPEDSTVLDFAFKIHNDLGLSFKYAQINNSPSKLPPYTKINQGDKINIYTNKEEDTNKPIYCPKLKWIAYAKTDYAKRSLIKYFEKTYGIK